MVWAYCEVSLRRLGRRDKWCAIIHVHGTKGPMVGWEPILGFYGAEGWELVNYVASAYGTDLDGIYLAEVEAVFKRPVSTAEIKRNLQISVARSTTHGYS